VSGYLAGKVWQSDLDAELKPLAAALADIGNDDGTSIYPSVAYMCWLLKRSERAVQTWLRELIRIGVLVIVEEGGGQSKTNHYEMDEDKLPKRARWGRKSCGVNDKDNPARRRDRTPQLTQSTPQSETKYPASDAPDTSLTASSEPPTETERERENQETENPAVTGKHRGFALDQKRGLADWMRDAARNAGKRWPHEGRKNSRGPTKAMVRELHDKEKTGGLFVRIWWIDFLLDGVGDEEWFPYAEFLNHYYPKRMGEETDRAARESAKRELEFFRKQDAIGNIFDDVETTTGGSE
jgi:hypothetical protein